MNHACKKCKKPLSSPAFIYSMTLQGYVCLDCYHHQFPSLPLHPKPIFIEGYNKGTKLLAK
ncbi:MAG: hypothetical protein R6U21_06125 [Thermoplasmatota archaeon]